MGFVRGLGKVLVVVLVVLVVALGGVLAAITARALPQESGTLHISGLDGTVTVVRDGSGIAHIDADTPHDLFLAQGYVHAQERLWQMEVWRHISAGRLSELFGPSELKTDKFIRTLGWRQAAERDLKAVLPETRAALDAYTAGVNAYLDGHRGSLGLAFVVIGLKTGKGGLGGYDPEPWTALDSAAWQKVQAWNLAGDLDAELFRVMADAKLGDPAKTDELFPPYPKSGPVIVPSGAQGSGGAGATPGGTAAATGTGRVPTLAGTETRSDPIATDDELNAWHDVAQIGQSISELAGLDVGQGLASDHGIGSNNWVVSPSKSATHHALLANDPHLGIAMPSVWYMNGLHCRVVSAACPYDVVGVSFPGVPLVILGHNGHIAWGATNVGPDVQDLFIEKPDPANANNYLFRDKSIPFTTRTETINVAGGNPVTITVRETGHGPILNDVDDRLKGTPGPLFALRWTATAQPDTTIDSFLLLNKATDYTQFRAALARYQTPSQNFVYADIDGHIGYQMPGFIPIRQDPSDTGGRPVPGWDGQHEWIGQIAYDDLPRLFDPPSGLIVTANNAVVDGKYPYVISRQWDPGYRAGRIAELLEAASAKGVTLDEMRSIQVDTKVPRASLVIPHLVRVAPATDDGRTVLNRIDSWDGTCGIESLGCAAYMTFEYRAIRDLFDDELGDIGRDYVGSPAAWQSLIGLLAKPTDAWWDDVHTSRRETEPDILANALDEAGRELRAALGNETGWTWGRVHTATFREATLGESGIAPLEWYFDAGPFPAPGTAGAIDNTYFKYSTAYPNPFDPTVTPHPDLKSVFEVTNLPSYRLTVDMGDLDGARIVQTTGNAGNPFDRHYGDLIGDWLHGQLVPLWWNEASVTGHAASTLTLSPAASP